MENLREVRLSLLSTYAQDVVLQAWSPGTKKSYNVYLKLWGEYCTTNRIDMKNVTVNDGIEFLAFLFYERNLGYSAVNTARPEHCPKSSRPITLLHLGNKILYQIFGR